MPWLSEEVPNWEDLPEEEQEAYRAVVLDLGMTFPDPSDDTYYE